jgi:hypothetical protein
MSVSPSGSPSGTQRPVAVLAEAALLAMTNTALDELFRAAPAGAVPDGNMTGTVLAFPGTPLARPLAALTRLLLWQGKVVNRRRGVLKNKLTPLRLRAVVALVEPAPSWVDDRPCVLLDYSRTSLVARPVRDELRLVGPRLHLGVVWLGRRRALWFTLRG